MYTFLLALDRMDPSDILAPIVLIVIALFAGKAIANWYYEVKTRNKLQEEILQELREIKKIMKPEENKTENEL